MHDGDAEVGLGLRLPSTSSSRREGEVPEVADGRVEGAPGRRVRDGPVQASQFRPFGRPRVQELCRIINVAEGLQDVAFDCCGGRGEGRGPRPRRGPGQNTSADLTRPWAVDPANSFIHSLTHEVDSSVRFG